MRCGIDEAGRGPVLGPLVMCGVLVTPEQEEKLVALGVKDSKLLSEAKRIAMFSQIIEIVSKYVIISVTPQEIDAVLRGTSNLNWLEADTSIRIVRELQPELAILDCPSTNENTYKEYVAKKLPDVELIVEHKADANYPVVSAASILAKVTRDNAIKETEQRIGIAVGSGYPSDPVTQQFLARYWSTYPELFRQSWSSYQKVLQMKTQTALIDYV